MSLAADLTAEPQFFYLQNGPLGSLNEILGVGHLSQRKCWVLVLGVAAMT